MSWYSPSNPGPGGGPPAREVLERAGQPLGVRVIAAEHQHVAQLLRELGRMLEPERGGTHLAADVLARRQWQTVAGQAVVVGVEPVGHVDHAEE